MNALLFLYKKVLHIDIGLIEGVVRAKRPKRLPVVLTRDEVRSVLNQLDGTVKLVCLLLYGTGMRVLDGLQLRVKDVDFAKNEIRVRDGKGGKDRVTVLPASAKEPLLAHLKKVSALYQADLAAGLGRAPLPHALARKYPGADREWAWQYVFPASSHYTDRHTGIRHRHHLHESVIQKAFHEAVRRAAVHCFNHWHTTSRGRHNDRFSGFVLAVWNVESLSLRRSILVCHVFG